MNQRSDIEEALLAKPGAELKKKGKDLKNKLKETFNLNFSTRLALFVFLNILGYFLQLGTLARFMSSIVTFNPVKFALCYTLGNSFTILAAMILFGFENQINKIRDPKRAKISIIFFGSLFSCIIIPLISKSLIARVFVFVLVLLQMVFYWIYSLSFYPRVFSFLFGRFPLLSNLMSKDN